MLSDADVLAGLEALENQAKFNDAAREHGDVASYNDAYKAGGINRLWRDWMPPHRSGDTAIAENYYLMNARVRDLFRNDPVMKSAKRNLGKHVIGTGIQTFADVQDGEEPDDKFNFESDDRFERWSDEEADAEGKFAWPQMQIQHFSEVMESGNAFLLKCYDDSPGRSVPLCYQLLENEQLDTSRSVPFNPETGTRTVRGIELDKRNRAIAYYIFDAHPYDWLTGWSSKSTRIPADRVIHTYLPNRSSESQGVTWFAANLQPARDLDWYLGNELTASALGALFVAAIKRKNGAGTGLGFSGDRGTGDAGNDVFGNPLTKLGRGIIADIGSEDDVKIIESNRPSRDARPFVDLILMLQGMGVGMSYLRLTGDYRQTSYTSARGAHLDDQAWFVVLQDWFARSAVVSVRRQHTIDTAAFGGFSTLSARQFAKNTSKFLRLMKQAPGREQIDPEKETQAAMCRIRAGLSTHQIECGLRGYHWRRLAIQAAREKRYFESLGVQPDLTPLATITKSDDEEGNRKVSGGDDEGSGGPG